MNNKLKYFYVQLNLCTSTTLGTPNEWPLLTGGHCSLLSSMLITLKSRPKYSGRCRQVVAIRRWSLAQVWLYLDNAEIKKGWNLLDYFVNFFEITFFFKKTFSFLSMFLTTIQFLMASPLFYADERNKREQKNDKLILLQQPLFAKT